MAANGMQVLIDHPKDDDGYMEMCELVSFERISSRVFGLSPNQKNIIEKRRLSDLANNLRGVF